MWSFAIGFVSSEIPSLSAPLREVILLPSFRFSADSKCPTLIFIPA